MFPISCNGENDEQRRHEHARPLMPALRYRDCNAALDFLTQVFGFTEGAAFRDDNGNVQHAELWFGTGGIMIGPVADTPFSKVMRQPDEAGGVASFFCAVDDPDAHPARSQEAGFEIIPRRATRATAAANIRSATPKATSGPFGTYAPQPPK